MKKYFNIVGTIQKLKILFIDNNQNRSLQKIIILTAVFWLLFIISSNDIYAQEISESQTHVIEFSKEPNVIKVVLLGHTQNIVNNEKRRNVLISAINSENADIVFFLGDSEFWKIGVAQQYTDQLNADVYSVPGNHDVSKGLRKMAKYITSVGYLQKVVKIGNVKFILIDSQDSIENIKTFVSENLASEKPERLMSIMLTHHRIWDDEEISKKPYSHDKSYRFEEIFPILENRIKYIFAGNSPKQYFVNQYTIFDSLTQYSINNNIVYWCDIVKQIECYSLGMSGTGGMSRNIASYIVLYANENTIKIEPRSFHFEETLELYDNTRKKISRYDISHPKELIVWVYLKLKSPSMWVAFICGILITVLSMRYIFIGRK